MPRETSSAAGTQRSRAEAQRRADQIAAFRAELAQIAREGGPSLDPDALAKIASHHEAVLHRLTREFDVDTTAAARRMSRGMQIASALGAAALVAAVVAFVYRVWGSLPLTAQVAMVTAAPLAGIALTVIAARLERTRYVASLFAIVACAAFVLQTVVLGQLFNLRGSPHSVGAWAAFALALSVAGPYVVPFAWGIATLLAYLAALMMGAAGVTWTSFPERPETLIVGGAIVAAGSVQWPLPFQAIARAIALAAMLVPILVLSSSGGFSVLPMDPRAVRLVYQAVALAAAAGVITLGLRRGWKDAVVIGSTFAAVFMLTRFVDWWWDWMPKYLFFLIVAGVAMGSLWMLRLARRRAEAGAR